MHNILAVSEVEAARKRSYSNDMSAITLKAHFDGQRIVLDEPFELPSGAPLMVTVLPGVGDTERSEWAQVAAAGLARAYSDDEPEYSAADVKP